MTELCQAQHSLKANCPIVPNKLLGSVQILCDRSRGDGVEAKILFCMIQGGEARILFFIMRCNGGGTRKILYKTIGVDISK